MENYFLLLGIASLILYACVNKPDLQLTLSGLDPAEFQTEESNAKTNLFVLKNKVGMEVCIANFGGRIVSDMVPDQSGKMKDVVDNVDDYIHISSGFGASIGRYANRINQGRFTLDGKDIQLPKNNYGHCLHGGPKGWQYQVYGAHQIDDTPALLSLDNMLYVNADINTPIDRTFMTTGEIASVKSKKGIVYKQRASVCLETQHCLDSSNKPQWHSTVLLPGQTYKSECIF